MPLWVQAGFWGTLAGSALLLGALVGYFAHLKQVIVAGVMAFGGGVLFSALAFDLMGEAYDEGGFLGTASGFLGGAVVYSLANGSTASRTGRSAATARVTASARASR